MRYECSECGKMLSTSSNRLRHMRTQHPEKMESEKSEEEESEDSDSEEMESENSEESCDGRQEVKERMMWNFIIAEVVGDVDFPDGITVEEILSSEKYLKLIIKAMGERIYNWNHVNAFLNSRSKMYRRILKTRKQLTSKEGYSIEEANMVAFMKHWKFLKCLLQVHKGQLKEILY